MTTELSLLANYDDLQRCSEVLTDGTAEKGKFNHKMQLSPLQFLNNRKINC